MKKYIAFLLAALMVTAYAKSETALAAEPVSKALVENTDVLAAQARTDEQLQAEAEAGYTFEEPLVVVDPYGNAPLSAVVVFTLDEPASISLEVEGKNGTASLTKDFDEVATQHQVPVYGLYAGEAAQVTLTAHYEDGGEDTCELSVAGGDLPATLQPIQVVKADEDKMAPGWTFLQAASLQGYVYAIDETGAVRWILNDMGTGTAGAILPLRNGNFLIGGDKSFGNYYKYSLFEIDLLGRVISEYMVNGYHHGIAEMPNGDLLVLANNIDGTVEDTIYELRRSDGEIVRTWDMNGYFNVAGRDEQGRHISDVNYRNENTGWTYDWLHINAIDYDPESDTVLLSSRHQDALIKLDLTSGEIVWVLSDPNDDWPAYLESKLLTPEGDGFEWQYGQHCVTRLPNGDVMCFDNGDYRSKTPEGILPAATDSYSRAVIYRVDEENMTVTQQWQFGKELGAEHMAVNVSGARCLGEDHYLIDFGNIIKDADGKATYNVMAGNTGTRRMELYEVLDDEVIFEAYADGMGSFQARRIEPYATAKEIDLTQSRSRLGALYHTGAAAEIDFDPAAMVSGGPEVTAADNGVQLTVSGTLDAAAENMALIMNGTDGAYGAAIPAGDAIAFTLNGSEVPNGTYELYLEVDGETCDLGLVWDNGAGCRAFPAGFQAEVTAETGDVYGGGTYYSGTAFTVWTEDGGTLSIAPNEGLAVDGVTVNGREQPADAGAYDLPAGESTVTVALKGTK